jgi:peroxiredoxin
MLKKKIIVFCCLLFLVVPLSAHANLIGQKLPAFTATAMNGQKIDLGAITGKKPVILVFWATWCRDCEKKLKTVNELYARYGKDIEFIGINVGRNNSEEKAREFIEKHKIPYPNIFDKTGDLTKQYKLNRIFSMIVATKEGTVVIQYNDVPEMGDETIEMLNTYVHKKVEMPPEFKEEMAKRLKLRKAAQK